MPPTQVLNTEGRQVGTYQRSVDTPDGEAMLIAREERLGGGTIVVPGSEADESDGTWRVPYGELSMREAPPYSPNVELHAYFEYWKRLGVENFNGSMDEYMSTGSGPVPSDLNVPDDRLREAVTAALREAAGGGVDYHLVQVSVKRGTVLLEGYQFDTPGRLAAAKAASVPGVKEIINMLVIRAF